MTLQWPWALLALLAVPLVVAWYRRLQRVRARRRAALAELGLAAPADGPRLHRVLPPALLLAALVLLLASLARPDAVIPEPRREGTVILAFDTSGSMAATDIAPARMTAAKAAARAFVDRQPSTVQLGVVAFAGTGVVTQQPTPDRAAVLAAIDRLSPQGGTGLARGLQSALGAVVGSPVQLDASPSGGVEQQGPDLGYHGSAAIVLLTDGEDTGGVDPVQVADIASTAGVRIYPIGLGTPAGTVLQIDGFQVATALNEGVLRDIASHTDGRYFAAADGPGLAAMYDAVDDAIQLSWTVQSRHVEVTGLVAALAALLVLAAVGLSLRWSGRAV